MSLPSLSKQEKKMLESLSGGMYYKQIATEHNISVNTVKKHLKNVYRKLNVHKRSQATGAYLAAQKDTSDGQKAGTPEAIKQD